MTISSSAGMSVGDGASDGGASGDAVVYGWNGLTFATGGATITIGTDVNADGVGEVDGVHASAVTVDHSGISSVTNSVDIATTATGVSLSTSMGGAAQVLFTL